MNKKQLKVILHPTINQIVHLNIFKTFTININLQKIAT